jgi:flagellar protein FlaF
MYAKPNLFPNDQATRGYTQTTASTGTPRSIELQAFQRVTSMLSASKAENAPFNVKAEAVYLNTKLWLTLAVDLLSPQNALPTELRAQLFGLAEFQRKHGLKVLSNQAEIDDLIEINTAIMRGLRGDTETGVSDIVAPSASMAAHEGAVAATA